MPFILAMIFHWRIKKEFDRQMDSFELNDHMRSFLIIEESTIKELHRLELSRREQLQRRAQAYLIAVTVAGSFVFGLFGLGNRAHSGILSRGASAIMVVFILYLAIAGFSALSIIKPDGVFELTLQKRKELLDNKIDLRECLIKYICLNQAIVLRHAKWSEVCYISLRNSLLGLFGILFLVASGGSQTLFIQPSSQPPSSASAIRVGHQQVGVAPVNVSVSSAVLMTQSASALDAGMLPQPVRDLAPNLPNTATLPAAQASAPPLSTTVPTVTDPHVSHSPLKNLPDAASMLLTNSDVASNVLNTKSSTAREVTPPTKKQKSPPSSSRHQ